MDYYKQEVVDNKSYSPAYQAWDDNYNWNWKEIYDVFFGPIAIDQDDRDPHDPRYEYGPDFWEVVDW